MQNTGELPGNINHLSSLAEYSEQIIFSFDVSTATFLYLNPAAKHIFEISPNENEPSKFLERIHPEDVGYLSIIYKQFLKNRSNTDAEFRILLPDNVEKWISVFAYFLKDSPQNPVIVGYGQDITHFKEHFKTLNKFASKKNAVLNILSHDLAGPLGSIQTITELLSKKVEPYADEEISKMVKWINTISKRGTHLIQEFVKQEFLESAQAALIKRRTDLVEIFRIATDEYVNSGTELKQDIRFNHTDQTLFLSIDETKFMQVIHNLVSNSMKFTPDGGTITIGLEEKENSVLITVQDTGIGIPEKYHTDLFDQFSPARRTGLRGEPTMGLGMFVIKTIVEWHEGKIRFDSRVGEGTTFYIEMPKIDFEE